ncbi:OmpH family outer membrane protein [Planctomicrobium piriforme]|uniref:Outer membrane protein (OmpH-like) n=1 Tax=Planctomicrobium piriforme TaxID=1576369 RepID=A0A1I3C6E0_9PLAN|nr:OmpH family outer membrane protein [Planctomicrobium piriforme]SFH70145.1 Outer membrane protein (OmpH-like) [Planctomicrobium piriforme]
MTRNIWTSLATVAASCACSLAILWGLQGQSGVAVVDLDEVAKQLGRDLEIQSSIQIQTEQLQQKLSAAEQSAAAQLTEVRKPFGEHPTAAQEEQFRRLQQSAQSQLAQLKQKAEQEIAAHRQQLVARFKAEARPIAAKIARKHRFGTVVTKNDSFLFSFDEAVDITADVVAALGESRPATADAKEAAPRATARPLPTLNQPDAPAAPTVRQVTHEEFLPATR